MRIDVSVYTKKKLVFDKSEKEDKFESHWLRFEREMGDGGVMSGSVGRYMLTDIDYLMKGNTFFDWNEFKFRNV
jgi:hypothetical protein